MCVWWVVVVCSRCVNVWCFRRMRLAFNWAWLGGGVGCILHRVISWPWSNLNLLADNTINHILYQSYLPFIQSIMITILPPILSTLIILTQLWKQNKKTSPKVSSLNHSPHHPHQPINTCNACPSSTAPTVYRLSSSPGSTPSYHMAVELQSQYPPCHNYLTNCSPPPSTAK